MNYIHNDNDFATEPRRGLPALLPAGEFVLWQGTPNWRVFAREVYNTRVLGAVVLAGAALRFGLAVAAGTPTGTAVGEASVILGFGAVGIGILMLLAWLTHKTTVYTITNKRVLLRIGVALQKTFNVPFAQVEGAALKRHGIAGAGSLSIALKPGTSIAYLLLWPHVRPWRMGQTEPMLRGIDRADEVARLLADAFTSYLEVDRRIRAAATATDDAPATNAPAPARAPHPLDRPGDPHHVPRLPLLMAAGIVMFTVLFVGLHQWTSGLTGDTASVTFAQEIRFQSLPGDRIAIVDAADGTALTTIEAGSEGLLRGALRGLLFSRDLGNLDPDASYRLERHAGDGLYLVDPLNGRDIRLDSFGPVEAGALADLLALGR